VTPYGLAFGLGACANGCAKQADAVLCNRHRTTPTPHKQERCKWGCKKLYINYITHDACFAKGWLLIISRKSIECILKSQVIFWLLAPGLRQP
jgi:hypothetical protein